MYETQYLCLTARLNLTTENIKITNQFIVILKCYYLTLTAGQMIKLYPGVIIIIIVYQDHIMAALRREFQCIDRISVNGLGRGVRLFRVTNDSIQTSPPTQTIDRNLVDTLKFSSQETFCYRRRCVYRRFLCRRFVE
jgi:hypothetical protein